MRLRSLTIVVAVIVLASLSAYEYSRSHAAPFLVKPALQAPALDRSLRPNYPYSVIPGGVYSPAELSKRLATDLVAARHYIDFSLRTARLVTLDRDTLAFVSYRIRDTVYWTNRKILIRKGETLLTDGAHYARTRCGNRISEETPPGAPRRPNEPIAALSMPPFSLPLFRSGRLPLLPMSNQDVDVSPPRLHPGVSTPEAPLAGLPPNGPLLGLIGPPPVLEGWRPPNLVTVPSGFPPSSPIRPATTVLPTAGSGGEVIPSAPELSTFVMGIIGSVLVCAGALRRRISDKRS